MKKIYSLTNMQKTHKIAQDFNADGLFRLIVFNDSGELVASNKLNVFCDQISIYKNHLYVLDTYYLTRLYKHKIKFN